MAMCADTWGAVRDTWREQYGHAAGSTTRAGRCSRRSTHPPGELASKTPFDALPVPDALADLVVTCSALERDAAHGGAAGLAEMERVCTPDGLMVVVWPSHLDWLSAQGFT